jgi:hypothetical protein
MVARDFSVESDKPDDFVRLIRIDARRPADRYPPAAVAFAARVAVRAREKMKKPGRPVTQFV